jgi:DNA-binding XRE family transcriptional regulator
MTKAERLRIEKSGWRVTTVQELLGLSDAENRLVELKVALSTKLKEQRRRRHLSQAALAKLLRSSKPRVAKTEGADPTVSLDLLFKALFATGITKKELTKAIAT